MANETAASDIRKMHAPQEPRNPQPRQPDWPAPRLLPSVVLRADCTGTCWPPVPTNPPRNWALGCACTYDHIAQRLSNGPNGPRAGGRPKSAAAQLHHTTTTRSSTARYLLTGKPELALAPFPPLRAVRSIPEDLELAYTIVGLCAPMMDDDRPTRPSLMNFISTGLLKPRSGCT